MGLGLDTDVPAAVDRIEADYGWHAGVKVSCEVPLRRDASNKTAAGRELPNLARNPTACSHTCGKTPRGVTRSAKSGRRLGAFRDVSGVSGRGSGGGCLNCRHCQPAQLWIC